MFLSAPDPARLMSSVSDAQIEAMFALTRKLRKADVAGSGATAGGQIVTYTGLRRTTGRRLF